MAEPREPDAQEPIDRYRGLSDQLDNILTAVAVRFQENMKRAMIAAVEELAAHADQVFKNAGEKMRSGGSRDETFAVRVPGDDGGPDSVVEVPVPQGVTVDDEILDEVRQIREQLTVLGVILGQR